MATQEDYSYLPELTNDIDENLLHWLTTYDMSPLNLIAVMLARLTWMAKNCDMKEDYLRLLEEPKNIIDKDGNHPPKTELH